MNLDLERLDGWDNSKMARYNHKKIPETEENREMQRYIRSKALYSLAVLGKSFITYGSGKFFNIRPPKVEELEARTT